MFVFLLPLLNTNDPSIVPTERKKKKSPSDRIIVTLSGSLKSSPISHAVMSNRVKEVNGTGNMAPGGPKQPEMVFNSTTGQLKTDEQENKIMFSKKYKKKKKEKSRHASHGPIQKLEIIQRKIFNSEYLVKNNLHLLSPSFLVLKVLFCFLRN